MPHPDVTQDSLLTGRSVELLEREGPLTALCDALALVDRGGRMAAISGEAGIGKSSVISEFVRRARARADFFLGCCDALRTPSPLGPLVDIAARLGGRTAAGLGASAPRHLLFSAFIDDLAHRPRPAVVVIEDLHWADEATLDLVKYVARRIDRTRALFVVTWRDDEVDLDHPMHRALGEWRHDALRVELKPLTLDAVRQLAGPRDAAALYSLTGGNPFFVTELVAAGGDAVPATVREAVLARRATLDADARAVLDFVSIVPSRTEFTLVEAVLNPPPDAVERCMAAGLLAAEGHAITFRHELARLAVASALPASRAHHYHRTLVDALLAQPDRSAVLARIVHHADACGAADVIVEHGPAAARQAAAVGAHRQAVDHFRRALRHRDRVNDESRAELLESYAYELYVTGDMEAACEAQRDALAIWRRRGVPLAIGRNLRWLSRLAWFAGDRAGADACADDAIEVLQGFPDSEELAMAYSNRSQLAMLARDVEACVAWGTRAMELARRIGSVDVLAHALNNVGTARANAGDPDGTFQIEESLDLALGSDLHEHAARAYTNFATSEIHAYRYATAHSWLERGLAYTADRDLDAWGSYLQAWRAKLYAQTGAWELACADAEAVLAPSRSAPLTSRLSAMAALGLVQARRGDAAARETLGRALAPARRTQETQRLVPVLAACAEMAWMAGDHTAAAACAREALDTQRGLRAEERECLEYWLWKSGGSSARPAGEGPYAQLARGDWPSAAAFWAERGCPYEEALALIEGDLTAATRALETFQTLGAAPAAEYARQRLRKLGTHRLPRGPRSTTRAHPAGLTRRESEILALLAAGLRNPQIGRRLFVSRKTVEHHVSSILGKLGVSSREEAVVHARHKGWL